MGDCCSKTSNVALPGQNTELQEPQKKQNDDSKPLIKNKSMSKKNITGVNKPKGAAVKDEEEDSVNMSSSISQWEQRSKQGFESNVTKMADKPHVKKELQEIKKIDSGFKKILQEKLSPAPTPIPKPKSPTVTPKSPVASISSPPANGAPKLQESLSAQSTPRIGAETNKHRLRAASVSNEAGQKPPEPEPKGQRRASVMQKQRVSAEAQEQDVQAEMEMIRKKKLSQYRENHVEKPEVSEKKQEEEQKRLIEKQEEQRIQQEFFEKKRADENRRQAEKDREVEEQRKKEADLLKKKVESGKPLTNYEKMLAQKTLGMTFSDAPELDETSGSVHSSAVTERPQVKKLAENKELNKSIQLVSGVLDRVIAQQTGGLSLSTDSLNASGNFSDTLPSPSAGGFVPRSPIVAIKDIGSLLAEMKFEDPTVFQFNNMVFFTQFPLKSAERMKNSTDFADFIANREGLQKLEAYNSGLDDVFLEALASHLKDGKLPDLKEIHLENNLFTGAGLEVLMNAVADQTAVPSLKTLKLVKQKEISTAAEQAAMNALKSNCMITKLTMDFRRDMDIANLNQLLAKNARYSRVAGGRSSDNK